MALKDSIADLIRPAVESAGFFLEDVQVIPEITELLPAWLMA